jgi:CheY-like chemotaxis protein
MDGNARLAHQILIVEDDTFARDALSAILRMEGYDVCAAPDGQEALRQLRGGYFPDLILLDLMMPCMDGREFRRHQRQDPELCGIPIIICSATIDIHHEATALGAAGYLQKPIQVPGLLAYLRRHFEGPTRVAA